MTTTTTNSSTDRIWDDISSGYITRADAEKMAAGFLAARAEEVRMHGRITPRRHRYLTDRAKAYTRLAKQAKAV